MTPSTLAGRITRVRPVDRSASTTTLDERLVAALEARDEARLEALRHREPVDERDALMSLLVVYDLWMAPLSRTSGTEDFQSHPAVAEVKWRLERRFIARLDSRGPDQEPGSQDDGAAQAIRRIAAEERVPSVYRWLAQEASWSELVGFLAIEGGPDAGFDDLVALAQVGIHDGPKVALARNYWDELGRGDLSEVHTVLHERLVGATRMPRVPRNEMPVSALERVAVGGLLATNRRLQPEMLGALGLTELQAGPRCRAVVDALARLGAPEDAFPFYEEHARADPVHGKEWLDEVVEPLERDHPQWGPRMVRGARWRHEVNRRFFTDARLFIGR
jgi:hypothetical protein